MKLNKRKTILLATSILLLLAVSVTTVLAASGVIEIVPAPSQSSVYSTVSYNGALKTGKITEQTILQAFNEAGAILETYNTVEYANEGALSSDGLAAVVAATKKGIPYCAEIYRNSTEVTDALVASLMSENGVSQATARAELESLQNEQYLLFLSMLDQNPDCYVYSVPALLDHPELEESMNGLVYHSVFVSTEYETHGYETARAYLEALQAGECENYRDAFIVTLEWPSISVYGDDQYLDNLLDGE